MNSPAGTCAMLAMGGAFGEDFFRDAATGRAINCGGLGDRTLRFKCGLSGVAGCRLNGLPAFSEISPTWQARHFS